MKSIRFTIIMLLGFALALAGARVIFDVATAPVNGVTALSVADVAYAAGLHSSTLAITDGELSAAASHMHWGILVYPDGRVSSEVSQAAVGTRLADPGHVAWLASTVSGGAGECVVVSPRPRVRPQAVNCPGSFLTWINSLGPVKSHAPAPDYAMARVAATDAGQNANSAAVVAGLHGQTTTADALFAQGAAMLSKSDTAVRVGSRWTFTVMHVSVCVTMGAHAVAAISNGACR